MAMLHAVRTRPLGELIRAADAEELSLPAGLDVAQTSRNFALAARRLGAAGVAASAPALGFWVPGRVEVAGKHTDYAGGRSLLCAVTRGFYAVSAQRDDALFRVHVSFGLSAAQDEATLRLQPEPSPSGEVEAGGAAGQEWVKYPAAVARRLTRNWGPLLGVELALECDLPEDSGLSSSSALITLSFLALAARNQLASRPAFPLLLPTDERLCHYLGCIENGHDCGPELPGARGVGTFGGSEDHTAIVCCNQSELRQYSFCPTRLEAVVPFPDGLRLIIAVSGAAARKGAERMEDYNNAAMLAGWAAEAAAAGEESDAAVAGTARAAEGERSGAAAAVEGGAAAGNAGTQVAAPATAATTTAGAACDGAPDVGPAGGHDETADPPTLASVLQRVSEQMGLHPSSDLIVDEAERR
jgi:galactokinase